MHRDLQLKLTSIAGIAGILVVQLWLPAVHSGAFFALDQGFVASVPDPSPRPDGEMPHGSSHVGPAHDQGFCSICFALSQGKTTPARPPLARAVEGAPGPSVPLAERRLTPPRAPDLVCSGPRAPPLPLTFA